MRTFFVLFTGLVLMQATVAKAYDRDLDMDMETEMEAVEYADTFDATDAVSASAAAAGWNRWTCIGKRPFIIRMYRGSSFYFRAGSGEGQNAKLVAQKIAQRACEFATNATCSAKLSDCTVESH